MTSRGSPDPRVGADAEQRPGLFSGFTENKNINGPWLARSRPRAKLHGTDWANLHDAGFRGGRAARVPLRQFLVAIPSLTREEIDAIVGEAHRMGLKVACHMRRRGMRSCVQAIDLPMHLLSCTTSAHEGDRQKSSR
jgi:hypothetical protein